MVEEGWECVGGNPTTPDKCYKIPTVGLSLNKNDTTKVDLLFD